MPDTATKSPAKPAPTTAEDTPKITRGGELNARSQGETDGFTLVIDALKLNGIDTIFGMPGRPKIVSMPFSLRASMTRVKPSVSPCDRALSSPPRVIFGVSSAVVGAGFAGDLVAVSGMRLSLASN